MSHRCMMDGLPTPSESNNKPTNSLSNSPCREPEPTPEDNADIALLVITSFVCANLIPTLVCRLPQSHTLTWLQIFSLAARYIPLTAGFGAAGVALPWLFLKAKPSFGLAYLSRKGGIGWLYLPCITLFYRQHSPWMLFVVTLATIVVTLSLCLSSRSQLKQIWQSLPHGKRLACRHSTVCQSLTSVRCALWS
jgi:hypothetical protein